MDKITEEKNETIIRLDESDIESAIRQFICSCYPEYAKGYKIDPTSMPKVIAYFKCKKGK